MLYGTRKVRVAAERVRHCAFPDNDSGAAYRMGESLRFLSKAQSGDVRQYGSSPIWSAAYNGSSVTIGSRNHRTKRAHTRSSPIILRTIGSLALHAAARVDEVAGDHLACRTATGNWLAGELSTAAARPVTKM